MSYRESPNSRINSIKRFLSSAPPGSSRLRCLHTDQGPIPIGEWPPLAAGGDKLDTLAAEIEQLLLDTASEKRRHRTPFMLSWCDENGQQKICKELTVYGHQVPRDDDTPEDLARELDGTTQSQLAQTQRHLEAMMRIHGQAASMMFSTMASTIDRLSERCAHMENVGASRHEQLLEAKETVLGLESMMKDAAGDEQLTPAQLKAFELAEKYLPGFLMWAQAQTQRTANANGKAKSNGEGKAAA